MAKIKDFIKGLAYQELYLQVMSRHENWVLYTPEYFEIGEGFFISPRIPDKGWALEYVPEEFKTYELCLMGVKKMVYFLKLYRKNIKHPNYA